MNLAVAVEAPARWVRRISGAPAGLAVAAVAVGGFSGANVLALFLRLQLPPIDPSFAWAWNLGVAVGGVFAFAVSFLLWLYLVIGIFLTLSLTTQVVSLARLTRLVGVSFLFPLVGMVGFLLIGIAYERPLIQNICYWFSVAWGIVVLTRAISDALEVTWSDAALGFIVSIIALEVLLVIVRLL